MSTVSLAGQLEDLGLSDILQILALSRKSGVLRLRHADLGLELFVRGGNVVAGRPAPSIATLHRFFLEQRLLDERQQGIFIGILRDKAFRVEPWTAFWSQAFGLPEDIVRGWAERYLVWLVAMATAWNRGEFSFELDPTGEAIRRVTQVPVFPWVPDGLSAQFLALESARISDESATLTASGGGGPADELTVTGAAADAPPPAAPLRLLVVEDSAEVADRVADGLRAKGYPRVAVAYSVDGALQAIEQLGGDGWVIVSDLVMPKRDRSGVLGGLEVAQDLHAHAGVSDVYLCSDLVSPEIREQALAAGARGFITKPGRKAWKTDAIGALKKFVESIATTVGPPPDSDLPPLVAPARPAKALPAKSPTKISASALAAVEGAQPNDLDADDPLAALMGLQELQTPAPRSERGVHLLRQMVEELVHPDAEGEITLLILRFAANMLSRAVLLAVTDDAFIVLGEVGLDEPAARRARGSRLPRGTGSLFDRVLADARSHLGPADPQPVLDDFLARLGGPRPREIFVGPVLAGGRPVAMLYADQLPTTQPIGDVEALEIFLGQAGMALERSYLRRQLRELDRRKDD